VLPPPPADRAAAHELRLLQAVLDPYINAMHVALLRQRRPSVDSREWFAQLRQRLLIDGPDKLSGKENMAVVTRCRLDDLLHREFVAPAEPDGWPIGGDWRCASTTC